MNPKQQCDPLPLDVEILIKDVIDEMLRKGIRLEEATRKFEVALKVFVLKKFIGDESRAAKLLGIDRKMLFYKLRIEEIGDNWWKWSV